MNTLIHRFNLSPRIAVYGVGFLVSVLMALIMFAPTHALSLSPTIAGVVSDTAAIPVVGNVTSLLTPSSSTPVPPQTVMPATNLLETKTIAVTPTTQASSSTASATVPVSSHTPISAATVSKPLKNGQSIQSQIAAASLNNDAPGLTYSTHVLNPHIANILFFSGLAGLLVGGYIMYMTRTKLGTA